MLNGHNDLCVGIDLGTTNSVLATINTKANGDIVPKVVEIPRAVDIYNTASQEAKLSSQKKTTLPSCVYYREEKNFEPLVGDFAKIQYALRPHLVAKSIKSQMGNKETVGLSNDIPDKTPAEVSANILRHLINQAEKIYRCNIDDVVITVPANFDSVMCKATRDAAELAGIRVKNDDGTERPVLLSEPNAVIYDLINQINNGEISNHILDLSSKKRVLVFDLGGGTLDITMHEIMHRDDCDEVLKVTEIATNRYTLLGGDDFDEAIAEVMYSRYIKQYDKHPEIVKKLKNEKDSIMPQLRSYAEGLKIDVNNSNGECFGDSMWGEEDDSDFSVGGNMGGIGFAYDDTFSKEDIENILEKFMGNEFTYDSYKRVSDITGKDTRNIIYPILDVLNKASKTLNESDIKVDAVIVNGGMSKFYMITDRLTKFFGFEPIVALDPDQAVARGAAVYHHYLHKYEAIQDDMRLLGDVTQSEIVNNIVKSVKTESKKVVKPNIEWGNNILNDALYLGIKNGAVHEIIPTGAILPHHSSIMSGFRLMPNQNRIDIPIKSQNIDGSFRTIASGSIKFKKSYPTGSYVAFDIYMSANKVITMNAWTCYDDKGETRIETGNTYIDVGNLEDSSNNKKKIIGPKGSKLNPAEEINSIIQLYNNFNKSKRTNERGDIAKKVKMIVSNICGCGNPEDFSTKILETLETTNVEITKERMYTIARRIGHNWTDAERKRLAKLCMNQLYATLQGFSTSNTSKCNNIQAIYTLSMCIQDGQYELIKDIHSINGYRQASLFLFGKLRKNEEWVLQEFNQEYEKTMNDATMDIQGTVYALGMLLRRESTEDRHINIDYNDVINKLWELIKSRKLNSAELNCCMLVLGWICDTRYDVRIDRDLISVSKEIIEGINRYYDEETVSRGLRSSSVALKMINGETLDEEDEQFLLTKMQV